MNNFEFDNFRVQLRKLYKKLLYLKKCKLKKLNSFEKKSVDSKRF